MSKETTEQGTDMELALLESKKRQEKVCWYALNVTQNHEFRLCEYYTGKTFPHRRHRKRKDCNGNILPPLKPERVIEAFVPYKLEKHKWKDRTKIVPEILVPGIVFVRFAMKDKDMMFCDHHVQSFIYDKQKRFAVIIPDDVMDRFIRMVESSVELSMSVPTVGDTVQIVRGDFKGMVGEVVRTEGNLSFQLRLTSRLACLMKIDADDIMVVPEGTESQLSK